MRALVRWIGCLLLAGLALEAFFVLRIATMAAIDPQSTAFQRSEMWQIALRDGARAQWRQQWVPYAQIHDNLKRAVIASEDADFVNHDGVEWEAVERARQRNARAEELAARRAARAAARGKPAPAPVQARLRGGSTVTQQLAKNLLLSGERTLPRKGQELVLTMALELFLSKQRILEIYLNSVEWGNGVFGAEAAAQRYFGKSAARLSPAEAARLAVMLPSPQFYEMRPNSAYLNGRTATIVARMGAVELP
ncbi:transglycosylase domain-containing protein [Xenophilus aerolatus]|nr:transglycosylase domain-containing protein [Xenophilus aerolatus]